MAEVTVYTRPGCSFCTMLRTGLQDQGLPFREVDIWQDPSAAETVRSLANGNETVPTVVIDDWSAVNPPAADVVEAATARGAA